MPLCAPQPSSRILFLVVLLLFMLVYVPLSQAQVTINVPADQPTIQAAINAANGGDTVLVAPGTYPENINFSGKAITVTSSGGSSGTIIDGGAKGAVVTFNSGEAASSQLSGFTIRNGFQNGLAGGGIIVSSASPTISGNVITGNRAAIGIGIYVNGGSPIIKNNTITANNQTGAGDGGQGGGGILVSGSSSSPAAPQIIGNTITSNSVASGGNGGGISVTYFSSPLIQANLIQGNTAYNDGGGISLQSYNSSSVIENIVVNNATLGGGSGGGIWVSPSSSSQVQLLINNTIANNTAIDNTSGIFTTGFAQNATFTNNIIVAASGQNAVTCNSTYSSVSPFFSFNDAYSVSGQAWAGICDSTTQSGNVSVDPLFINSTTNFHLQSGSPVIDAGDNSAPNLPSTDFDGNTRIWDGNNDCVSTIDLGAYELTNLAAANISPRTITFGSQLAGTTSAPQSATASSVLATCWQYASSFQVVGPFLLQANSCPSRGIPAGTSCNLSFVYTPNIIDLGTAHGFFAVTSITGTSLYVDLYGTAVAPAPVFSPTYLNFSSQIVGTVSVPQIITVTNTGNGALIMNSITTTGDFSSTNGCGSALNPGGTCAINVSFAPSAFGSRAGSLVVADNDSSSPRTFNLSGTGVDFAVSASPSSVSIDGGDPRKFTVSVSSLGGPFTNPVALTCSGLPSDSSCTFSPTTVTPGTNGASSVMTLTTSRSRTPTGTFQVYVTGTSGPFSRSTQIQLTILGKH